jgi:hypothetical protein
VSRPVPSERRGQRVRDGERLRSLDAAELAARLSATLDPLPREQPG